MHELSLAEGILTVLEEAAQTQGFTRVNTVWLEIGALAAVEVEALRFCFQAVAADSLADGAQLSIIPLPGAAWCLPCGRALVIDAAPAACPHCGGYQVQVTGGHEMRIKELEVE